MKSHIVHRSIVFALCALVAACALAPASGLADEAPAPALTLGGQGEHPTSAEVSVDGRDYGWLYLAEDGKFYILDSLWLPDGQVDRSPMFVMVDGRFYACWHIGQDAGEPWDPIMGPGNAQWYEDGLLVYQCDQHYDFEETVRLSDSLRWGGGSMGNFSKNAPFRLECLNGTVLTKADITRVRFDKSLLDYQEKYGWPGLNPQYADRWFEDCFNLRSVEGFENMTLSETVSMARMYAGCTQLGSLDMSAVSTPRCTDFAGMFEGCLSLAELTLGDGWTQARAAASRKATFPVDMVRGEGADAVTYKAGEVIPDGAGYYRAVARKDLRMGTAELSAPAGMKARAADGMLKCEYTGSAIEPAVRVEYDGAVLQQGRDYDVSFAANTEVGSARAIVSGKGDYYGAVVAPFEVEDTSAWAFLFESGLLVLKAGHDRPSYLISATSLAPIASMRLFDAYTENPGAQVPWDAFRDSIATVAIDPSFAECAPITIEGWFADCPKLSRIRGLANIDATRVRSIARLFAGTALAEVDLRDLDSSGVEDASGMFEGCTALEDVRLQDLDFSSVRDASRMFAGCTALSSVSLRNLDMRGVQNLSGFFDGCTALEYADLRGMKARAAADASGFFAGCAALEELDVRGLDLAGAADLRGFLRGCTALVEVDLTGASLPAARMVAGFFSGCEALESVNLGGMDATRATDAARLLEGCPRLRTLATGAGWRNASAVSARLVLAADAFRIAPTYARMAKGTALPEGAGEYCFGDIAMQLVSVVMEAPSFTCTGKAICPTLEVRLGETLLKAGTDYTVTYSNNVLPGTARAVILGKGLFTGGLVVPFTIKAAVTKVGDRLTYKTGKATYVLEVTKVTKKNGVVTAAATKLVSVTVQSASTKTLALPTECTIGGVRVTVTAVGSKLAGRFRNVSCVVVGAKVTRIAARAFAKAPKVKKLKIRSARLASVKDCLAGSKVANVVTDVKLSNAKRLKYQRWFLKGAGKKGVRFVYMIK